MRRLGFPALRAWPGSGCWHSSKTGLMDCPTGADPAVQEHLACDAALEPTGAVFEGASTSPDAESWRGEVAARLERYRARRKPHAPRYPSLLLPFDSAESWSRPLSETNSAVAAAPMPTRESSALRTEDQPATEEAPSVAASHSAMAIEPEASAKVIEFPRSAAIPVAWIPELADPVMDRPRIVECPEVLPPPPALGGILMEPAATKEENRTGADFPQASASIPRRLLAGVVDSLILGAALAAFAAIFLRLNPACAPLPMLIAGFLAVTVLLWAAYEFLFVVYTGSTPGLRALRLRLVRFDGSPIGRPVRRWRVLASFLSAFSLGLGYLWSVLDEDGLCWHDRITRTHIQAGKQAK
ncbi:MAG: RDD family protein [Acidobacteriia bacterium]|nr:RDD family protein [Terriglobia bacterium]